MASTGQFPWPSLGSPHGRQRVIPWPPMGSFSWPLTGGGCPGRVALRHPWAPRWTTARMQATASRSTWWAPVQSQAVLRCTDAPMVMMRPIAATTGQPFLPDRGAVDSAWQVPVRTRPRALRRPGRPRPLGRCRGGGGGLVRRPPKVSPSPRHVDRHKRRPCCPAPRATPLPGLYVTRLVPAAESGVGVAGTGINGTRDGTAHSSAAAARRRRHGQRGEALLARR